FWAMFRPTAPLFDLFEDIIVSGEERMMKPDPAIFALARRRFGLGPGEALFVDDQPRNVAAAEEAGWLGHRFETAGKLAQALGALGLTPSGEAPVATR
ncbi:MAG: HAD-IA family hydrolase, partial [Sphingomonadaceae bacterium]